jgi:hypothetical protein
LRAQTNDLKERARLSIRHLVLLHQSHVAFELLLLFTEPCGNLYHFCWFGNLWILLKFVLCGS